MPEKKDQSTSTLMAVLCYFGILVLVPLLTDARKDPFVNFHIKQGLGLLIVYVISYFLIQWWFIGWLISIVLFILFIIGVVNAATGKKATLPLIGELANAIKI